MIGATNLQEAQLSQRDGKTDYASSNLVNCCTTVRKITLGQTCRRWI